MAGHRDADFAAGDLLDLVCDLVRDGRILIVGHFLFIFFLGELGVFLGDRTLCNRKNGEAAAALITNLDRLDDLVDIIRDLRKEDDVRTACDTGVQRKPANLMAHDFNDEDAAVGGSCGVNVIDALGRNVQSAVETEGHIRSVEIVVDGLGKGDDIEAFLSQKVCSLGGAVAAAHDQAVELQFVVSLLHGLDLVQSVFIGIADGLERASAGSEHCTAAGQNALEITAVQNTEFAVDQSLIAVFKAVEFDRFF